MMFGDTALEPEMEMEDLGDEFAAACAADEPSTMTYSQEFATTYMKPQRTDNMLSAGDALPMDILEGCSSSQDDSQVYQQLPSEQPQVTYSDYEQIEEQPSVVQNQNAVQPQMMYAPSQNHPAAVHQQAPQQQAYSSYGQVMYQQHDPASFNGATYQQLAQPTHVVQQQPRQAMVMPVHRAQPGEQSVYIQEDGQAQPIRNTYIQHYPDGRSKQVVYVKRMAQPVQMQSHQYQHLSHRAPPQRIYVQTPQGLVAKQVQQMRIVKRSAAPLEGSQPGSNVIQRTTYIRPMYSANVPAAQQQQPRVVAASSQQQQQLQSQRVVQSAAVNSTTTPVHVSRMVDHGDYAMPSSQNGDPSSHPAVEPSTSYPPMLNGHEEDKHVHSSQQLPQQNVHNYSEYPDQPPVLSQETRQSPVSSQETRQPTSASSSQEMRQPPAAVSSQNGANVDAKNSKVAPTFTGVYPLKPPSLPIPKKKKPEPPVVATTDGAQAAAVQRIGTEEGWKQMNAWLKSAGKDGKTSHMRDLLKQCLQASVSVDLLMSNDTPKFVRKLAKNHEDSEVKKTAGMCVEKWKKEIANPEVPSVKKEKKKAKKEEEEEKMDVEEPKESTTSSKTVSSPGKDGSSKMLEKRRSSDTLGGEKSSGDSKKSEKKVKAKARVYTAKSRMTGLEELSDDSSKPPEAKKKKESSTSPSAKTNQPAKAKKPATPVKKVSATLSTGFMDALFVTADPKPKKKVQKKRPSTEPAKETVHDPSATPTVLDGLFADQTKVAEAAASRTATRTPTPPVALAVAEEPDLVPTGRRKIRFADEMGKELVFIKEFEIEEGERINVNHMTPEDMKHHELMMERKFKESSGIVIEDEEEKEQAKPVKWRLELVDDAEPLIEFGHKSEARIIELERQKTAMRAFADPNFPCTEFAEPDDYDPIAARMHVPPIIPLELVVEKGEEKSPSPDVPVVAKEEPAASAAPVKALPDNLQNLLDGLKKKGIVGGGPTSGVSALLSGLTAKTVPPAIPANSSAMPPTSVPHGMPPAGTTVPPVYPTYQQHNPASVASLAARLPPRGLNLPPSTSSGAAYPPRSGSGAHFPPSTSAVPARADNMPAMPVVPVQRLPPTMQILAQRPQKPHGHYNRQCQFYMSGRGCHFGDRCKFAHGEVPQRNTNTESHEHAPSRGRGGYYPRGGGYGTRASYRGGLGYQRGFASHDRDRERQHVSEPVRIDASQSKAAPDSALSPILSPGAQNAVPTREAITIPSEPVIEKMDTTESPASPT